MSLRCPFCAAPEAERVSGIDGSGSEVVLLMFDCPFFIRIPQEVGAKNDQKIQAYLDEWRAKNGDEWLESIGPFLKNRELRGMERSKSGSLPQSK